MMAVKILHIIKSLGRGGAEMLLPETLKLHRKELFEFHYIYFLPWKNQMEEIIRENGGKVVCFPASNSIHIMTKAWAVADYVRSQKIQLIHAHLPWAGILARVVGKMCGIPIIYTEHNKQERYNPVTRMVNLVTMDLLTTVVAVSTDVLESIHKHKPRLKVPVLTILNGVNTAHFKNEVFSKQAVYDKLKIPADALVIGTIAVFRFQKRLDLWMELAAKILDLDERVHFIIVGDGPLKKDLLEKRDTLGLQDRIHLPGLETDVRPYLTAFDVYMMSSVFEGLPIALLEAMAMRCPVISTDAGGIKEVIRHEVDGFLCSVDEPQKLVGYASILLQNQDLRIKYGSRARKRVMEAFSMEKMVDELESVYRETLNQSVK
jgi:glycosyltransferase involved in cell wall biosynthesis